MTVETLTTGAVILAGGLARRMNGRDKGLIPLADKPMVKWVLERISPQVDEVVINANRHIEEYSVFGVPVVEDIMQGHLGPLAGLATGLLSLKQDTVFMCPCDSPFLPHDMVHRLRHELIAQQADICVAGDGERMQPVFCLVRREMLSSLQRFLDSGERKIDRWFAGEKTITVHFTEQTDTFKNINTEQERVIVEELLLTL